MNVLGKNVGFEENHSMEKNGFEVPGGGVDWVGGVGIFPGNVLKITGWSDN